MKLRSKPAVLILLALSALLLALLTLRTGRSKAPAPLAHPVSARQRPPALAPALILSQGTFTGTGQSAQRRRPLHPRPGAGNRDAASLEKLVR